MGKTFRLPKKEEDEEYEFESYIHEKRKTDHDMRKIRKIEDNNVMEDKRVARVQVPQ